MMIHQVNQDNKNEAISAHAITMKSSEMIPDNFINITGHNYEETPTIENILSSFASTGLQASNLYIASTIIKYMYNWKLSLEKRTNDEEEELLKNPALRTYNLNYFIKERITEFSWAVDCVREQTRATIFLSFTSNMITSGLRECFVYLAKNKLVDCIVTSAGGIEEDFIKCIGKFVLGHFSKIDGQTLRKLGWNRAGNIFIPNDNYVKFEQWILPIFDELLEQQKSNNIILTPSSFINYLGKKINDESSLYYWCYKNNIPVFCPSITDGSIGDCLFFYNQFLNEKLIIDVVQDIIKINTLAMKAKKSGIIILGGGMPKHHVCNANLMRNGADFAVYINTAIEFDGSDSGGNTDEAISWGKINSKAKTVKVWCDASIAFPLLVASVFREVKEQGLRSNIENYIQKSPY